MRTSTEAAIGFSPVIEYRTESARKRYNRLAGWHAKVEAYIAAGRIERIPGRAPSKQVKGFMYDDVYWTARALGAAQAENLIDVHDILVAAKAAGHLTGTIKPVPAGIVEAHRRWFETFGTK